MNNKSRPTGMTKPSPQRAGTLAVGLTAIAAAWVLTACEPAIGHGSAASDSAVVGAAMQEGQPLGKVQFVEVSDQALPKSIFGQISSIEPIKQKSESTGAGAVVGGVLGAALGNQIGDGKGRTAATVIGGVGGAVAGNKVEQNRSEKIVGYRIHVQLDSGGSRSFERNQLDGLDVGARVKIDDGNLQQV